MLICMQVVYLRHQLNITHSHADVCACMYTSVCVYLLELIFIVGSVHVFFSIQLGINSLSDEHTIF
jgi:hypothetical protein